MKMYLNNAQTTKLIELGFEKPKGWCNEGISYRFIMAKHKEDDEDFNYSIGELLSFLPKRIDGFDCIINLSKRSVSYNEDARVNLRYDEFFLISCHDELIDALYEAIVELKRLELNKKAKWVNRHDTKDKKD